MMIAPSSWIRRGPAQRRAAAIRGTEMRRSRRPTLPAQLSGESIARVRGGDRCKRLAMTDDPAVHNLIALDLVMGAPPKRRQRRPSPVTTIKRLLKAGIAATGATIAPDGSVSVTLSEPAAVRPANSNGNGTAAPDPKTNEWDGVPA
jgi:hypothetical protein